MTPGASPDATSASDSLWHPPPCMKISSWISLPAPSRVRSADYIVDHHLPVAGKIQHMLDNPPEARPPRRLRCRGFEPLGVIEPCGAQRLDDVGPTVQRCHGLKLAVCVARPGRRGLAEGHPLRDERRASQRERERRHDRRTKGCGCACAQTWRRGGARRPSRLRRPVRSEECLKREYGSTRGCPGGAGRATARD